MAKASGGVRHASPLTGNFRPTFLAMLAHPSAFVSLVGRGGVAEKTVHDTGLSRVQRDVVLGGVL
jgi:hypothetical protein